MRRVGERVRKRIRASVVIGVCGLAAAPAWGQSRLAPARSSPARAVQGEPAGPTTLAEALHARLDAVEARLAEGESAALVRPSAAEAFRAVLAHVEDDRDRLFSRAAFFDRLTSDLEALDPGARGRLQPFLMKHPGLAASVVFALRPSDDAPAAYGVLDRLVSRFGDAVAAYPELTAAICVVHDGQGIPNVTEFESPNPATPEEIFWHLTTRVRRPSVNLATAPVGVLVHVVNIDCSLTDLAWALDRHEGDRMVGRRYHDVRYDTGSLKYGRSNLRKGDDPFSLPKILARGGVCRHQAYYAAMIGKAIGVPTAVSRADGPDMGHAWVGYLRFQGSRTGWDFGEGRWDFYEDVRGEIRDPQSPRIERSDQQVAMTVDLLSTTLEQRWRAAAYLHAARTIRRLKAGVGSGWPPAPPEYAAPEEDGAASARARRSRRAAGDPAIELPREPGASAALELLERSLRECPVELDPWDQFGAWSSALELSERGRWAEVIWRLAGERYPDVAFTYLSALITSTPDPEARDAAWRWAIDRIGRKSAQIALELKVRRANDLVRANLPGPAWDIYADAAITHINDGPGVMAALDGIERLARAAGNLNAAVEVYDKAAKRVAPVEGGLNPNYASFSTRARVGRRFVSLLQAVGDHKRAESIAQRMIPKKDD